MRYMNSGADIVLYVWILILVIVMQSTSSYFAYTTGGTISWKSVIQNLSDVMKPQLKPFG